MAKNDVVLVDGIIQERLAGAIGTGDVGEAFELLALEELLKDFDLSRDEIDIGWTDGRDDGGIDGFYIFVNGHLLDDAAEFVWPRASASIDVVSHLQTP